MVDASVDLDPWAGERFGAKVAGKGSGASEGSDAMGAGSAGAEQVPSDDILPLVLVTRSVADDQQQQGGG